MTFVAWLCAEAEQPALTGSLHSHAKGSAVGHSSKCPDYDCLPFQADAHCHRSVGRAPGDSCWHALQIQALTSRKPPTRSCPSSLVPLKRRWAPACACMYGNATFSAAIWHGFVSAGLFSSLKLLSCSKIACWLQRAGRPGVLRQVTSLVRPPQLTMWLLNDM